MTDTQKEPPPVVEEETVGIFIFHLGCIILWLVFLVLISVRIVVKDLADLVTLAKAQDCAYMGLAMLFVSWLLMNPEIRRRRAKPPVS